MKQVLPQPNSAIRAITRAVVGTAVVTAAMILVIMVVTAFLDGMGVRGGPAGNAIRRTAYQVINYLPGILLTGGVAFFGASIGSFLNVVVHRMPRGESVSARASHCPRCQTPILARDNMPVVGWLLLGGRCRNCLMPISPRYPVVEFVGGLIALILFAVEIGGSGRNLPLYTREAGTEMSLAGFAFSPSLLWPCALQIWVLLGLLACGLIRRDWHPIPLRLLLVLGTVALAVPVFVPAAMPVAAWPVATRMDAVGNLRLAHCAMQLVFILLVGISGGVVAGLARYRCEDGDSGAESSVVKFSVRVDLSVVAGFALLSLAVGWQAILAIAILFAWGSAGVRSMGTKASAVRPVQLLFLVALSVLWIVFWRNMAEPGFVFLPRVTTPVWQIPLWLCLVASAFVASWVDPPVWPDEERERARRDAAEAEADESLAPVPASDSGGGEWQDGELTLRPDGTIAGGGDTFVDGGRAEEVDETRRE